MLNQYTILLLGGPGVGKTNLSNILLDGENVGGSLEPTYKVRSRETWALGERPLKKWIQVYDTPGIGNPEIPPAIWVSKLSESVDTIIDMVILVMESKDNGKGDEELAALAMSTFLDNVKPRNVFVCFTHCDEQIPETDSEF